MAEPAIVLEDAAKIMSEAERHRIVHDLELMDQFEVLVQSLPDYRAEVGLGPLPDNAVASSYDAGDIEQQ